MRISGYTAPIMRITEDGLVTVLDSCKGKEKKVVLFMTNKKFKIVHMPLLVEEIKQIGKNIEAIEGWTDPGARRPLAPQPPTYPNRRPSPPRRNEAPPRDNSSKKLKQRFNFQFKSLLSIVDGEAEMDSA